MTDEQTPQQTAPAAPTAPVDSHAGFAVYDETLTRYVGGVHPTKSAAEKNHPGKAKGHTYTTRKV